MKRDTKRNAAKPSKKGAGTATRRAAPGHVAQPVSDDRTRRPPSRPEKVAGLTLSFKTNRQAMLGAMQAAHPASVLSANGTPGAPDRLEQEADRAADRALGGGGAALPHEQASASPGGLMATDPSGAGAAGSLPADVRQSFDRRFNYDFSDVRIHTNHRAGRLADGLQARAFTLGKDIYFAPGQFRPGESEGRRLLAHELAHVVQQTKAPGRIRGPGLAASISRTPRPRVQTKLTATGNAAGFAALANSIITTMYEVRIGRGGVVSLHSTDIQGPPTRDAQELIRVLRLVINDSNTTTIEFINGTSSTRASDQNVVGGNYQLSRVDLDDLTALGVGAAELGAGPSLVHELLEQYRKQVHGESFAVAHRAALAAEETATGATRGTESFRRINATTLEVTVPYTYPDGTVREVIFRIRNGNIENVVRRTRP